ncbi:MAG: type II 3-dehydroquinate dehydratase [Myxococcales bacterium]|nr:type II 3-dehydroquinate dehydratase [Myxococcales bacterium]
MICLAAAGRRSHGVRVLVLNGPNLDQLGRREPSVYGQQTLPEIEQALHATAEALGLELRCVQSNHEGALIEALHGATDCDGIVINPAGYGHTSVALRDALLIADRPTVEVHLSNLARREPFRHRTLTADVAVGTISGLGAHGYHLALHALKSLLAPATPH